MNSKTIIIYQNSTLYNILHELSEKVNFRVLHTDKIKSNFEEFNNFIIITNKKILEINNQLVIDILPIKFSKLIEIINLSFLKKEYNFQSNIKVGKYELNLNSRVLSFDKLQLDLTEMETKVILFLKDSNKSVSVKKLQSKVWGHVFDLETHTVETHIYRLRKKIKDKFQDDNFIKSLKDGYKII